MKLRELLQEDAACGSVSAGAVAGFRGSLFGGNVLHTSTVKRKKRKTKKVK